MISLLALVSFAIPEPPAFHAERFLECIAAVETGGKPHPRGPHQLSPLVRRQWSHVQGDDAKARAHLAWLRYHLGDSPYRLALAWRGGLASVLRGDTRYAEYGRRVTNLYYEASPR